MPTQLLLGGVIHSAAEPFATALLIVDGAIAWIGDDAGASVHRGDSDEVLDLRGALVTPAFVDAHVHATATGLLLTGVDLTRCTSREEMLDLLTRVPPGPDIILGHGWDDTRWSMPGPPTTADIDRAVGDRLCYLTRIDVHSALVSTALRQRHDDLPGLPGFDPIGPLAADAHHRVRETALALITPAQRERAQRATLTAAAATGIASVHEMAGPTISSPDDLRSLLVMSEEPGMPEVIGYWGELDGHSHAAELGARGAAGDLFVDGSLGSHTACLRAPYADLPGSTGRAYVDTDQIARHVAEASLLGTQAGFHVIGDGGHDLVMQGFAQAVEAVGAEAVVRGRHRLEHVEMPDEEQVQAMARWGIVASVQSAFDATWGGATGMYATRLGERRARALNPYASMLSAGVTLALGSDSPVTPLDPWGSVRAAAFHHHPEHRVSVRAAFAAHTRGGRRAARDEAREPGVLVVGAPATFAIWQASPLVVQAPDARIAAWSTDPRSGTPGLPDLAPGADLPVCWRTVRSGDVLFDAGAWG